jgi:hypothetical protein
MASSTMRSGVPQKHRMPAQLIRTTAYGGDQKDTNDPDQPRNQKGGDQRQTKPVAQGGLPPDKAIQAFPVAVRKASHRNLPRHSRQSTCATPHNSR